MKNKIVEFNSFIREQVKNYPQTNIVLFDAYDLFEKVTSMPEKYGFKVVSEPCLNINRNSARDYLLSHGLKNECSYHTSNNLFSGG